MVYQGWRAVGGKFRPWGAVRGAERIGRIAQGANYATAAGSVCFMLWRAHRVKVAQAERAEQERAWPARARSIAEETIEPWVDGARAGIEELYSRRLDEVAGCRLDLLIDLATNEEEVPRLLEVDHSSPLCETHSLAMLPPPTGAANRPTLADRRDGHTRKRSA